MHSELLTWYDSAKRDLPWRRTSDPYAIWVSEIMLQQTQVSTVIPYWEAWMRSFPTIADLARADEEQVLSLWQGLGYYRRCRLLLDGARHVAKAGLPTSAAEWRSVPGVGPYTAGAIASIAQSEPAALVDGNVERVYSRLTSDGATGPELNKNAWDWARSAVHHERPGDWNQALMELGATICTPVAPACVRCPLRGECAALATNRVSELPTKQAKPKAKYLHHVVWIPVFEGRLGLRQIPKDSWWEGMWEFPRAEVAKSDLGEEPCALREMVGDGWVQYIGTVKHTVTNHRIAIAAHLVRCDSLSEVLVWKSREELPAIPMPAPQRKVLKLAEPLL
jgi:A/G-specific adenine glycosylase